MTARPTHYLAQHHNAGRALFTRAADARDWCDRQSRGLDLYPDQDYRWVSDGPHGWEGQLANGGEYLATVYRLVLDGTMPEPWPDED